MEIPSKILTQTISMQQDHAQIRMTKIVAST